MMITREPVLLLSDERVARMPVRDIGEPLIDTLQVPCLKIDTARERVCDLSPNISLLRAGVVQRLLLAQDRLPQGVIFLICEGHRPVSVQQHLFDWYSSDLRKAHAEWSKDRIIEETSKFVAPPTVAPHSTGGAVDLLLIESVTGNELDMGSPFNGDPALAEGAHFTLATNISPEARRNRAILCESLQAAGFVNYPCEWWHWSYGDKYWACLTRKEFAIYGAVEAG